MASRPEGQAIYAIEGSDSEVSYDSTADTLRHSQRVGELLVRLVGEILARSTCHDRSKTEDPELAMFNEYTPKLKTLTYGSDEYKQCLDAMGEGLRHHWSVNRHHPEHFTNGVAGMTLVDVVEMLADWKAATERMADGDLIRSLEIQRSRFDLSDQLAMVLWNTAREYGWLRRDMCGCPGRAPNGDILTCTVLLDPTGEHAGPHADGLRDHVEWKS